MGLTVDGALGFYVHDRPVAGRSSFVGREQLVRSLETGVLAGRGFVVCGGPKLGRSSILAELSARLSERMVRKPHETKVVPIALDLGAFTQKPTVALAKALWTSVVAAIYDGRVVGKGDLPPPAPELSFVGRGKEPWGRVFDALAELERRREGTSAWCHYVLLVDGADALVTAERAQELAAVGAMLRGEVRGGPSAVVLTGGRGLREALLERDGPLSRARLLPLTTLRESEAATLVRLGLPGLPKDELQLLLITSGRHPYVLSRLLAELERQPAERYSVEAAVRSAWPDLASCFDALWRDLDLGRGSTYRGAYAAPEHALLQLLIDYKSPVDLASAEAQLGLSQLREFAELLEYEGLVERTLKGDKPYFAAHFDLWNRWYADRIYQ